MDEHAPIVYDLTSYREETKEWDSDPSAYLLRYYTKYCFLATGGKDLKSGPIDKVTIIDSLTGLQVLRGDQFVYQSPNKLCITGLAPTHPLIAQRDRYQVLNLQFDQKIFNSLPQPTAIPANSKKQPPPSCHCETVICKIEAVDLWAKKELEQMGGEVKAAVAGTEAEAQSGSMVATMDMDPPDNTITTAVALESTPVNSTPTTPTSASASTPRSTSTANENAKSGVTKGSIKHKESVDPTRVIFVVRGAISGHVIELNESLLNRATPEKITDPAIIQTMLEKASTHGFIAVVRPKIDKTEVALKDLCTMEEYEELRRGPATATEQ